MKRKFLIVFLTIIMILTSASALFACDKTSVDSYSGTLSAEGYATESEAAKAYLQTEFAGETEDVVFEKYEKKKDLTRKEIEKLPLGEYKATDIEKAEKGEIRYTENAKTKAAEDEEIEVQIIFIVLVFVNGQYHHCDLIALPGEKISKSYYTSVLDFSQYDSYTFESENKFSGVSVPAGYFELTFTTKQKMICTQNAVYIELKTEGMNSTPGMQDIDTVSYIIQKNNEYSYLIISQKLNDGSMSKWQKTEIPGTLKDYASNTITPMDQSYFIKTDDGFKLDEKKYGQYLEKIYGAVIESLTLGLDVKTNNASAVYHVSNGHLSSAKGTFNLSLTDGKDTMSIITSNSVNLSNINASTLTVPQEVLDLLK